MVESRPQDDWVCLARVATAHGVRGALKLRCFTEIPEDVAAYGPVYDRDGRRLFDLEVIGPTGGGVIARAEGVADRDQALALRGTELFVPRVQLPEPEPDEFYCADLEGLDVLGIDGERLGTVRAVDDYGAGPVIEIRTEAGKTLILPFDRRSVPTIDLASGRLVVDPPEELLEGPEP
jgi:16S rRNA processing protein RimM